jgi:hypothetical protein
VDSTKLPARPVCLQHLLKNPRGRAKERRLRKAERRRRARTAQAEVPDNAPQRCAQRGAAGHNQRTYKEVVQVPLIGGRA